jgi:iron(III) transport system ATP-binding protein
MIGIARRENAAAPSGTSNHAARGSAERRVAAPGVEIDGATKRFGAKVALDAVSLAVEPGSFLVLLGPSGSGKTTLLRCLAGIERLSSGTIAIGDRLVADGNGHHVAPERRDLSMVFQDYALWPHLTAQQNVAFALARLRLPKSQAVHRSLELLDRVGLAGLAARFPNELSGGEQQRVALARALAAGTGLLLFDEPLSNLDATLREELRVEIATLAREAAATAIYITHDQAEAFALADRIGVLQDGHIVQLGAPEEVYRRPASAFVARFTGLAGSLRARCEGPAGQDRVTARLGDTEALATALAPGSGRVAAGTAGSLLLRQSAVRLRPHAHGGIVGRITDAAFRGRGYDHAVELPWGDRLVGVHDERRWSRGDSVCLSIDPEASFFFPDGQSEPASGVQDS